MVIEIALFVPAIAAAITSGSVFSTSSFRVARPPSNVPLPPPLVVATRGILWVVP